MIFSLMGLALAIRFDNPAQPAPENPYQIIIDK